MKKSTLTFLLFYAISLVCFGQTVKTKTIDNGSSGPYKAIATSEASLPDYTVYRPSDIKAATAKEGKLPILVFANGGCSNTSLTHERVLSEIASHGYVVIAIGALQMTMTDVERKSTDAKMLLDAIDWITTQNNDSKSDYYNCVDISKISSAGQSCGGAQILVVAGDPRIKTLMMFNSGMGDMSMAGASKESLKALHSPIIYIVGGPSDVAFKNAELDYSAIANIPVAFANLEEGGHMGTFGQEFGGSFSKMALDWLDWQFKGKKNNASVFLNANLGKYPGWTMKSKNFKM
jgi:hypothetical protein